METTEEEKLYYAAIREKTEKWYAEDLEEEVRSQPLKAILSETRDIVASLDTNLLKSRLENLDAYSNPILFKDLVSRMSGNMADELEDISADLDARLVKQARSLDNLYDLFLQLTPYALAENNNGIQSHVSLALKAQNQSAHTIEKFKRLREKSIKIADRTKQIEGRTKQNATLD